MLKLVEATCQSQIVTAEGKPITVAEILSQGNGTSSGVILIEGDKVYYLTSNATDIKNLITSLEGIITQISLILAGLDAVTVSPGAQAAQIVALTALKTQLGLTKELLK